MEKIVRRLQQKVGSRLQRAIGTDGVDNGRGESDTCKEYSSWAVPDGALDASRNESNNRDTAPHRDKLSDDPGS